jgi:hypothetical protein
VLLVAHAIRLGQPCPEVRVEIARLRQSEGVQVIARRKCLDSVKARVIETSGKNQVPVEPCAPRCDLRERHPNLEGNPRLLGQNPHGTNGAHGCHKLLEERPNRGRLATEVVSEREAAAGV